MIEWKQITMQEAENKMEVLREIFDIVRLLKGSDLQAAEMESELAGKKNLCQCYASVSKSACIISTGEIFLHPSDLHKIQ